MRLAAGLLVLVLAAGLAGAAQGPWRDPAGDVERADGSKVPASASPSVDIVRVTTEIDGPDRLATVWFAGPIPRELTVSLTAQLADPSERIGTWEVTRSADPSKPSRSFGFIHDPDREPGQAAFGAVVGERAVQFVLPLDALAPYPCFAPVVATSSHLAIEEDGTVAIHADAARWGADCAQPREEARAAPAPTPAKPAPAASPRTDLQDVARAAWIALVAAPIVLVVGAIALRRINRP